MVRRGCYLVAFIDELMGTSDELEAVDVVEFRGDLVAKQPPGPSRRYGPSSDVFGITPYQIAEGTFVGDLLSPSNDTYLIQGTDFGTQAAVDAEDFAVDDCTEDQKIKDLAACFPD